MWIYINKGKCLNERTFTYTQQIVGGEYFKGPIIKIRAILKSGLILKIGPMMKIEPIMKIGPILRIGAIMNTEPLFGGLS